MQIEPRGSEPLQPNGFLPSAQTTTPYQVYDAFVDATKAATGWDIEATKRSLKVLSETFDQTAPHLSDALDGVKAFSDTIGKRGEQLKQLLANANKIARVLGDRSGQVNGLLVNANTLLAAFKQRSQALSILLSNVSAGVNPGVRPDQGKPQPQPCAAAVEHGHRRTGQAQEGTRRCAGAAQQVHRIPDRGCRFRAVLQGDGGEPGSLPDPSAVG